MAGLTHIDTVCELYLCRCHGTQRSGDIVTPHIILPCGEISDPQTGRPGITLLAHTNKSCCVCRTRQACEGEGECLMMGSRAKINNVWYRVAAPCSVNVSLRQFRRRLASHLPLCSKGHSYCSLFKKSCSMMWTWTLLLRPGKANGPNGLQRPISNHHTWFIMTVLNSMTDELIDQSYLCHSPEIILTRDLFLLQITLTKINKWRTKQE